MHIPENFKRLTRVQKINLAIEIMYSQKNMGAKEIRDYLRERKIMIDIQTVRDVIKALRYLPPGASDLKRHRPWFSEMQDRLTPIMRELGNFCSKHNVPLSTVSRYLNDQGLVKPIPQAGEWKDATVKRYLKDRKLLPYFDYTPFEETLTYDDFCVKLDAETEIPQMIRNYLVWETGYRQTASPAARKATCAWSEEKRFLEKKRPQVITKQDFERDYLWF